MRDNVYLFPSLKQSGQTVGDCTDAANDEAGDTGGSDGRDQALDASDLRAMAECLQYLYRESSRLDATTTSRLIGAAAMAVAEDIRDREG